MSNFFNSPAFFYLLLAGFAAYTVYYLYNVFKYVHGHLKARKLYKEKYGTENTRNINQFWVWTALYVFFIIYAVYSAVTIDPQMEQAAWFRMAFSFVALILFGQLGLIIVKRNALIGPEAFVVEDAVIPFKSVVSMDPKKRGFQRIVTLTTTMGKYDLAPEIGKAIHAAHEEWKKNRKEKKGKK